MNTEEKAKAYDKALNWMRAIYPNLSGADKEDAEHFFPQLAESEDERIRKELLKEIEFISPRDGETDSEGLILPSYHARIDRYRSYLERQKEQNPEVKDPFDDEQFRRGYEAGKNDAEKEINTQLLHWREKVNEKMERETFPDYDIKVIADDIVSGLKASGDVYENIHNAMEQKPATWHGDDGLKPAELTPLTDLLSNYLKNDFEYFATAKWDEKKWNEVMNIQASELLRVAQNELKKEQKSAEWSEEDEEIFNNIIEKAKGGHWIEVNEITWLIAWFKSLRLQPKQE